MRITFAIAALVLFAVMPVVHTQTAQPPARPAWAWKPVLPAANDGQVHILPVRGRVSMLLGAGGNITVSSGSDGILVGADAVGPEVFINKVGTAAICALASSEGVPVYVLAGREKVLSRAEIDRLEIVSGPPAQVVDPLPPGLQVLNPYFERIPLTLATLVVTDAGVRPAQSGSPIA